MGLLRRLLFGTGELPADLRAGLEAEGLTLLAEGLRGSVTYRHYRAPGERANWRKEAVSGAIAVSTRRLVVWAGRFKHIDVPIAGPYLAMIEIGVEAPDRIGFTYDAGRTNPAKSGSVEVRLRTEQAARVAELLGPQH